MKKSSGEYPVKIKPPKARPKRLRDWKKAQTTAARIRPAALF